MESPSEPDFIFPFDGMSVGNSFFLPTLHPAQMIYIIDTQAKEAGIRVRCFITSKEGVLGVRAWRTR